MKGVHFGPEDADLLPWVEAQTNFSAAVKALIRKELGLTPPPSKVDAEAIKAMVERLVNERLAQVQSNQEPKPETATEKPTPVQSPKQDASEEQQDDEDALPSELFKGIF